jgi:hypothetical protein
MTLASDASRSGNKLPIAIPNRINTKPSWYRENGLNMYDIYQVGNEIMMETER